MKSLHQRLLSAVLGWIAAVLVTFCVLIYLLMRRDLQGDIDQFVRDKAFILGHQVNPHFPAGMFYDEKPWRSDRYTAFGQTFDADWKLLYKSTRLAGEIPPTEEIKRFALHPLGVVHHDATGPDGARYRMATIRMEREGKFVCFVQVGVLLSERDKPLRELLAWLGGIGAAALLLAWLF